MDGHWCVAEPSEREALDFSAATDGAEAARTFAAGTDLSAATLVVHQYYVETCESRRLARLSWGAADQGPEGAVAVELEYERAELAECAGDDLGPVEATLFRIPAEVGPITRFGYQA
jgi:hypothetical protein